VSHRFSTVRMADLIVVLDGARVAQFGTHEDLMARGGQYADIYNAYFRHQSIEYIEAARTALSPI
jgi:ATP-binding cassette subfamily B protein